MLGKAMRFATVCALTFAICGKANRNKVEAVSEGTTEGLEHRFRQETNFEDHLSNTTNVSSSLLRKPASKTSSSSKVRRLAVILAFASPGVQPFGVSPSQKIWNTKLALILENKPLDASGYREVIDGTNRATPPQNALWRVPNGLCVCGESLIDLLPCADASGESAFRGVPGGSPFNCCIAAQRLGIPVSYLGALSTEDVDTLSRENVDTRMVSPEPNPTTLAFVSRWAGEGEYAYFKENAADRQLTKAYVEKSLRDKRFRGVHVSLGAVTLENGPSAKAFKKLFRLGGKMGALRTFDPNIRPNMLNERTSKYSKKVEKLLRVVDLVKASEDDVEFLYGKDAQIADVAAKWLKLGPKLVIITKGSKGAEAYIRHKGDQWWPKVEVAPSWTAVPIVDSVGAGDTFMGGLIFGILGADGRPFDGSMDGLRGSNDAPLLAQLVGKKAWDDASIELLRGVLRRAVTCAAINCARAGFDPPTAEEADQVLNMGEG